MQFINFCQKLAFSFGILYTGYLLSIANIKREIAKERETYTERVRVIEIKRKRTARKKYDKKWDIV